MYYALIISTQSYKRVLHLRWYCSRRPTHPTHLSQTRRSSPTAFHPETYKSADGPLWRSGVLGLVIAPGTSRGGIGRVKQIYRPGCNRAPALTRVLALIRNLWPLSNMSQATERGQWLLVLDWFRSGLKASGWLGSGRLLVCSICVKWVTLCSR